MHCHMMTDIYAKFYQVLLMVDTVMAWIQIIWDKYIQLPHPITSSFFPLKKVGDNKTWIKFVWLHRRLMWHSKNSMAWINQKCSRKLFSTIKQHTLTRLVTEKRFKRLNFIKMSPSTHNVTSKIKENFQKVKQRCKIQL